MNNFPSIGDIVMSPHDKFNDLDGTTKYDQLLCDGDYFDANNHPSLANVLPITSSAAIDLSPVAVARAALFHNNNYHISDKADGNVYIFDSNFNYIRTVITGFGNSKNIGMCADGDGFLLSDSYSTRRDLKRYDSDFNLTASFSLPLQGSVSSFNVAVEDGSIVQMLEDGVVVFVNYDTHVPEGTSDNLKNLVPDGTKFYYIAYVEDSAWVTYQTDQYSALIRVNKSFTEVLESYKEVHLVLGLAVNGDRIVMVENGTNGYEWSFLTTPYMTSPDPLCPYRIVADLTGGT